MHIFTIETKSMTISKEPIKYEIYERLIVNNQIIKQI